MEGVPELPQRPDPPVVIVQLVVAVEARSVFFDSLPRESISPQVHQMPSAFYSKVYLQHKGTSQKQGEVMPQGQLYTQGDKGQWVQASPQAS